MAGMNALMVYRGEPGTGASCVTCPLQYNHKLFTYSKNKIISKKIVSRMRFLENIGPFDVSVKCSKRLFDEIRHATFKLMFR